MLIFFQHLLDADASNVWVTWLHHLVRQYICMIMQVYKRHAAAMAQQRLVMS